MTMIIIVLFRFANNRKSTKTKQLHSSSVWITDFAISFTDCWKKVTAIPIICNKKCIIRQILAILILYCHTAQLQWNNKTSFLSSFSFTCLPLVSQQDLLVMKFMFVFKCVINKHVVATWSIWDYPRTSGLTYSGHSKFCLVSSLGFICVGKKTVVHLSVVWSYRWCAYCGWQLQIACLSKSAFEKLRKLAGKRDLNKGPEGQLV